MLPLPPQRQDLAQLPAEPTQLPGELRISQPLSERRGTCHVVDVPDGALEMIQRPLQGEFKFRGIGGEIFCHLSQNMLKTYHLQDKSMFTAY
jgi:hypothetical protein